MKADRKSKIQARKNDSTPHGDNHQISPAINPIQEHCLNLLSPELQKKVQELEQIPLLPDWPEKTRGVPNLCLRSALFGVIRRGHRRAVKGDIIAAVKGLDIRYTGWQLNQGDFDVMAQVLHLQNRHIERTSENYIRFQIKSFLSAIGRQTGKSGREWLKDCLRRLTATALEVNVDIPNRSINGKYTYAGSLVDEFYYNDREQTYFLKINPKLGELFDAGWTQLQWQQRIRLKTNLAKWLHGFYASHRNPYPMKVFTLRHLCGSSCGRLSDFRSKLRGALEELLKANLLLSWTIDSEDKVHVRKQGPKLPHQEKQGGIAVVTRGHSSHTWGA
ncbi:MAG: plasmid replication initiator TrfA [Desulforhopalus sp.]